jgi:acetolactate synthase-1/2/3 large subunit
MALNPTWTLGEGPLQDVSEFGMNIIPQLKAELGDGCIVIDSVHSLEPCLRQVQEILNQSRPVALFFYPDILSKCQAVFVPKKTPEPSFTLSDVEAFLNEFPLEAKHRRVILYVCSEAARVENIQELTTKFATAFNAQTVWSVNGSNAVAPDNPFGLGHIMLGGNDKAMELWRSMGPADLIVTLGFDQGEYSLNLEKIHAGMVWHFTDIPHAYGNKHGEMRHRVTGEYRMVKGNIGLSLSHILKNLKPTAESSPFTSTPITLNTRILSRETSENCVDLIAFYERLSELWRPGSIGFDDVCIAYKDRQYIMQRPHPHIRFYTMHDASTMGGAFGLAVGAKIACPKKHIFSFTRDGCWRLFSGALAEASNLGICLFLLKNDSYALVSQALDVAIPGLLSERKHDILQSIDFLGAAQAYGWKGIALQPDLGNLEDILNICYTQEKQSILIEVPVDKDQNIGPNPRFENLSQEKYL